jgi:molybdopterin/thiamine biosynthesis adenylyltransferase
MEFWPRINSALVTRGFKQVQGPGFACYEGELQVGNDRVGARIWFRDKHLQAMPELQLLARPEWLPPLCAHLTPEPFLTLCYPGYSTANLDPYFADAQSLWVLEAAEKQLQELRTSGGAMDDVLGEFKSYWLGKTMLLDVPDEFDEHTYYCDVPEARGGGYLVTTRGNQEMYTRMGLANPSTWSKTNIYFAKLAAIPPVEANKPWPPKTLADIREWITKSPAALAELKKMIGLMFDRTSRIGIIVYRTEGNTWFGFKVELPAQYFNPKTFHKKQSYVSLALGARADKAEIVRYDVSRIDAEYVVTRNLPEGVGSLQGKNILLVGAGTIGGHLGDAAVRLGAGSGGGKLTIVDKDDLSAGNVGRHRLPMSDVGRSKAHALADEMRRVLPSVNVEGLKADVIEMGNLKGYDLVIDATGYEPLSLALNMRFLAGEIKLMVYCWIVGNGAAVQTFVTERKAKGQACRRCLTATDDKTSLIPQAPEKVKIAMGRGCDAPYIPYSLTPSLAAAALGAAAVMDAIKGDTSPNLRTQRFDEEIREIKTKNVVKMTKCPACSR